MLIQKVTMERSSRQDCLFCRIAQGGEPSTELLYSDNLITVFKDIRPHAANHFLVIPKDHIFNANYLTDSSDAALVDHMLQVARNLLMKRNVSDIENARIGFHLPPLVWVPHLHMHVIYPTSDMSLLGRMLYPVSKPWFLPVQTLLSRLRR